jgi:hypothetical protein
MHVIALLLEGALVVGLPHVALHALKLCSSFDVVAKSGDGYSLSLPMACSNRAGG